MSNDLDYKETMSMNMDKLIEFLKDLHGLSLLTLLN